MSVELTAERRTQPPESLSAGSPPAAAATGNRTDPVSLSAPTVRPSVEHAPSGERHAAAVAVALVGGQRLRRDSIALLIDHHPAVHVHGSYACARSLLAGLTVQQPVVVLIDGDDRATAWRASLRSLLCERPTWRQVLLCGALRADAVRCVAQDGAAGIVLKSYSHQEIGRSLVHIAGGATVMPAGWQVALDPDGGPAPAQLTARQQEILAGIAAGHTNAEIAAALGLSCNTVKAHVREIYRRLGVGNRLAATRCHLAVGGFDA